MADYVDISGLGRIFYESHNGRVKQFPWEQDSLLKWMESHHESPFTKSPYGDIYYTPAIPNHAVIRVAEVPEYDEGREQFIVNQLNPNIHVWPESDYWLLRKQEGHVYVILTAEMYQEILQIGRERRRHSW